MLARSLLFFAALLFIANTWSISQPVVQDVVLLNNPEKEIKIFRDGNKQAILVNTYGNAAKTISGKAPLDYILSIDDVGNATLSGSQYRMVYIDTTLIPAGFKQFVITKDRPIFYQALGAASIILFFMGLGLTFKGRYKRVLLDAFLGVPVWVRVTAVVFIVWCVAHPVGGDIRPIAKVVKLAQEGVDVFDLMKLNLEIWQQSFPPFAYPPVMLSALQALQQITQFFLLPFNFLVSDAQVELLSISVWLLIIYIMAAFFIASALNDDDSNSSTAHLLCWVLACPISLYVTIVFQQVDILGVALIALGCLLLSRGSSPILAGFVSAIGILLKPQFIVVLPCLLLISLSYCFSGRYLKRTFWVAFIVSLISVVGGLAVMERFTKYPVFLESLPQLSRIGLSLWQIAPDLVVFSAPLFVILSYGLLAMKVPTTSQGSDVARLLYAAMGFVVMLFQSAYMHTPGMNVFAILGLSAFLVVERNAIRRLFVYGASSLSIASWCFTEGDLSRLILPTENTVSIVFSGLLYSPRWQSLLYTIELGGLLLVAMYSWNAYTSNRVNHQQDIT